MEKISKVSLNEKGLPQKISITEFQTFSNYMLCFFSSFSIAKK